MQDLTDRSSHFEFGLNWELFSKLIDSGRIAAAEESLSSLGLDVAGRRFLDIGSGSGLFSLAALRRGAEFVLAVDIDENSVRSTQHLLKMSAPGERWRTEDLSVFDLSPSRHGKFDVVYSWGVLHHTGDMWRAVATAAEMVEEGGVLALAIYERTPLCGFWRHEKRVYAKSPHWVQTVGRYTFLSAYVAALTLSGRNPFRKRVRRRGMDMMHDIHDWLGGYPYESTTTDELEAFLVPRGFERVLVRPVTVHLWGLFGSGCSEYVYRKIATNA